MIITCENAEFGYEGVPAVSGLSFAVNSGDYLCVVGENGSGKSTLIKGLLRLKKPQSGSVCAGDGLKNADIGYMPQQTAAQKDFPASAYEVVLSGAMGARGILPFYTRRDKSAADEKLRLLGIDDLRNRCYRELSGGQQQRVLLARALVSTKKLLLLDEPTAGLDPSATADFYELIEKLNRGGLTVIIVSHDVASAVKYASHILHLRKTQLFFGTTADYLRSGAGRAYTGGERDA
jgi:zinc transport system ATP-binding protein